MTKLLQQQGMEGCLSNICQSFENMDGKYIQPKLNNNFMSKFRDYIPSPRIRAIASATKLFYRCGQCNNNNFYCCGIQQPNCCHCGKAMEVLSGGPDGYVLGVVTYMVMDDLQIKPLSTLGCLNLLNKYNVKEDGALTEKDVILGMNEVYLDGFPDFVH